MTALTPIQNPPQPERRAEIIDAAIRAFARKGYGGSTLADIAAEAGVSQPRISQIFGNKENAFLAAHRKAANEVLELFRSSVEPPFPKPSLGADYQALLESRSEVLLMMFHGLTSSYVPSIGHECRRTIDELAQIVIRAGGTPEDARTLIERGLFVHAMIASGAVQHVDEHPTIGEMLETVEQF